MQADCESETERLKFQKLLEDYRKLLYPDCQNGLKKLGTTLESNLTAAQIAGGEDIP